MHFFSFLLLYLFPSVCFPAVRNIWLVEPIQTLFKWPLIGCDHSIYIWDSKTFLFSSFGTFYSFLEEIECTIHVDLPKRLIFQFKLVQQSRQQVIKAYCPSSVYTVDIWCFIITHKNQGLFRAGHVKENKGGEFLLP